MFPATSGTLRPAPAIMAMRAGKRRRPDQVPREPPMSTEDNTTTTAPADGSEPRSNGQAEQEAGGAGAGSSEHCAEPSHGAEAERDPDADAEFGNSRDGDAGGDES